MIANAAASDADHRCSSQSSSRPMEELSQRPGSPLQVYSSVTGVLEVWPVCDNGSTTRGLQHN